MSALRRAVGAVALAVAAACMPASGDAPPPATGFAGVTLVTPLEKPAGTFTTMHGEPYDLRAETRGSVTLLFFGYTHCPDVCPVHMANLAAVLRQAEPEVRSRVKVVFVTTDPARDTPERLRTWLGAFDPTFVGLVGPDSLVREAQVTVNVAPAFKQPMPGTDPDSAYAVGHAAQVIAFSPTDDRAHVLYPFGTRQQDWAADLPKLVAHEWD
jgi:protein SCO1/2